MGMFPNLEAFLLVVGNARSGSTVLGAVLDAHPSMLVANETQASATLWRGLDRDAILDEIRANAAHAAATGRQSEGYRYQIGPGPDAKADVRVVGDKIWNPTTLLLHGDHGLIPSLEERLGVPVRIIHAIRNPFDTIATMHRRSGASLANRTRWYFMHCDAAAAIAERLPSDGYVESHHDDLLATPAEEIERLCTFLGLPLDPDHVEVVMKLLFDRPRRTGTAVPWSAADEAAVRAGIARFPSLARYVKDSEVLGSAGPEAIAEAGTRCRADGVAAGPPGAAKRGPAAQRTRRPGEMDQNSHEPREWASSHDPRMSCDAIPDSASLPETCTAPAQTPRLLPARREQAGSTVGPAALWRA